MNLKIDISLPCPKCGRPLGEEAFLELYETEPADIWAHQVCPPEEDDDAQEDAQEDGQVEPGRDGDPEEEDDNAARCRFCEKPLETDRTVTDSSCNERVHVWCFKKHFATELCIYCKAPMGQVAIVWDPMHDAYGHQICPRPTGGRPPKYPDTVRTSLTLYARLLKRVQRYAEDNETSASAVFVLAAETYLGLAEVDEDEHGEPWLDAVLAPEEGLRSTAPRWVHCLQRHIFGGEWGIPRRRKR